MRSIYMDKRWGLLQQEKEKGEAITYVFEKDDMRIVYPFIKRKAGIVGGIQYFDIVTPRGQCGPWIEKCNISNKLNLVNLFNEEFSKYCTQENIVAEYIRFSPWIDEINDFSNIYDTQFYGLIFCNDLTCDFFKDEYSSKKRNEIRKAKKNGIGIVFDVSCNSIDDFLRLYDFTASKYQVSDYYDLERHFIEKYYEMIPEATIFAKAMYEGKVISSAIILMGDEIAHYHFSASNPEYNHLQGNSLLLYEASLYAIKEGKKLFDLGGAKEGSALEKFKRGFVYRGKKYPYSVGTKIRNNVIYEALVQQVGGPREGYFPAYRRQPDTFKGKEILYID